MNNVTDFEVLAENTTSTDWKK